MKVKDIMSHPVVTVAVDTTLEVVAGILLEHRIGCVPVVDQDGKLVGIITHADFIAREEGIPFSLVRVPKLLGRSLKEGTETIYHAARSMTARDIMTGHPIVLDEDDLVKTFLEKILSNDITHAPIMRGDEIVGIVGRRDVLKMIVQAPGESS